MAVNLKPPSYFSRPVTTQQGQYEGSELIPPSSFQKRKQQKIDERNHHHHHTSTQTKEDASIHPPNIHAEETKGSHAAVTVLPVSPTKFTQFSPSHLKEFSEATKALIELNKENVKLLKRSKVEEDEGTHKHDLQGERFRMPSEPKTIAVYQEPRHVDFHHSHMLPIEHSSQLITKQAAEIGQLKAEIQNLEAHYKRQRQEFKDQVERLKIDNARVIEELEGKLKRTIDRHAIEVEHTKALSRQKQNQFQETIQIQSMEIDRCKATLKEVCDEKLQQGKTMESAENQYKNLLRDCEEEKSELEEQVRRLQAYMSDSLESSKSQATWQVEKQRLNQQIKDLEKECSSLKTSLELTNLRLTSAIEIQSLQELQLSKEMPDDVTKTVNLLTKWRESVFKLMVQRKSQDLTIKMSDAHHKQQVYDFQVMVQSLNNEIEILNHKMSDVQAQLQIQLNRNKDLEEEVVSVQKVAAILDQRLEESVQACLQIKDTVSKHISVASNVEESVLTAHKKLFCYENRISFAVSRIEILKGLFKRKDAIWKQKLSGTASSGVREDVIDHSITNCDLGLKEELRQTIEERDLLAAHLKEDAQLAVQQMHATTIANKNSIQEKEGIIEELKDLLAAKSKDMAISNEKMLELECHLKETQKHNAELEQDLIQERRISMKVSEEKDAEYRRQLSDMEIHVNTARREHTKAVMCMRQCERQAVREKKHLQDQVKSQETFYESEVEKLRREVKNLQKDNSILKATLRQEGLIGRGASGRTTDIHIGEGDAYSKTPDEQPQLDVEHSVTDSSLGLLVDDVKNLTSRMLTSD
ncbi:coiled-coil alpha-helical rod protein 1-like isoform X2 [Anneissia japonica]|uniref:coiled-coil alpha-helical rod protein 1-like isoform X2 n=1 Tax=Anneissia japonica TaxID=1529436 RepID=UPI0014259178|nr:coiled-coil alpha-helical rod protein 1-like isoform X2 [Anneissia japonica]